MGTINMSTFYTFLPPQTPRLLDALTEHRCFAPKNGFMVDNCLFPPLFSKSWTASMCPPRATPFRFKNSEYQAMKCLGLIYILSFCFSQLYRHRPDVCLECLFLSKVLRQLPIRTLNRIRTGSFLSKTNTLHADGSVLSSLQNPYGTYYPTFGLNLRT
jgi:hypothetical protein